MGYSVIDIEQIAMVGKISLLKDIEGYGFPILLKTFNTEHIFKTEEDAERERANLITALLAWGPK
jgi:hypothetical protein